MLDVVTQVAEHHATIGTRHLRDLFADDPGRGTGLVVRAGELTLDYSKNRLTAETVRLLLKVSPACIIPEVQFIRPSDEL